MSFRCIYGLLLALLLLPAAAQTAAPEPKDAEGWFQRASDQMNLRTPGSAPFHMKVTFHAYPGIELTKKAQIITGDGAYEETWLAPRRWRREVTLGSYHAVEVQSETTRKMQASSDYEPSRVLMLLEALLNPVPRNYLSPELNDIPLAWKIKHGIAGNISYVRISRPWVTPGDTFVYSDIFLSNGMLVESSEAGLVTGWQDDVAFAGKLVPRHFTVAAAGRDLVNAEVTVEPAGNVDPANLDLSIGPADPGITLRPLHKYETNRLSFQDSGYSFIGNTPTVHVIRQVIDRHGIPRETELISAQTLDDAKPVLDGFRHEQQWRPAELDGSPCEIVWYWFH